MSCASKRDPNWIKRVARSIDSETEHTSKNSRWCDDLKKAEREVSVQCHSHLRHQWSNWGRCWWVDEEEMVVVMVMKCWIGEESPLSSDSPGPAGPAAGETCKCMIKIDQGLICFCFAKLEEFCKSIGRILDLYRSIWHDIWSSVWIHKEDRQIAMESEQNKEEWQKGSCAFFPTILPISKNRIINNAVVTGFVWFVMMITHRHERLLHPLIQAT